MRPLLAGLALLLLGLTATPAAAAPAEFSWPVPRDPARDGRTWREFNHLGLDIDADLGDPVRAIGPVYEVRARQHAGYGVWTDLDADKDRRKPGWVVFALHRKEDGSYFWTLYGHVEPTGVARELAKRGRSEQPLPLDPAEPIATIAAYSRIGSQEEWDPETQSMRRLPKREDHLHFAIWDADTAPSPAGYGPPSEFEDPETFLRDHRPYRESTEIEVVLDDTVHHLGNDQFDTPVNVGFQKTSEGLQWTRTFAATSEMCDRSDGFIALLLRGGEGSSLYLNETYLGVLENTLEDNGLNQAFEIPPGVLRPEQNRLRIVSNITTHTDNDDFEFDDVTLFFGDPNAHR